MTTPSCSSLLLIFPVAPDPDYLFNFPGWMSNLYVKYNKPNWELLIFSNSLFPKCPHPSEGHWYALHLCGQNVESQFIPLSPMLRYINLCIHYTRKRQWQPTPVLLPGKSHERRNPVGCSPWGHEESDMTERLHFHLSLSCIGEGNGNPLQCSCLEDPRDRGDWWAAIYGVAQSWTPLKRLSSGSSSSLIFRALICLEFSFVYGVRECSSFSFSFSNMYLSSFPSTMYWRDYLFSIVQSCLLCHQLTIGAWVYFWDFYPVTLTFFVSLSNFWWL